MIRPVALQRVLSVTMAALLLSCGTASSKTEQSLDPDGAILHLDYRTGGDAPLGFYLTVWKDGRLRDLSPRGRERWAKLDAVEQERVETLLQGSALASAFESIPVETRPFACCDFHEVGVYVDAERPPIALPFGDDPLPPEILAFLAFINELGREHFGRNYSMPLPVDQPRG